MQTFLWHDYETFGVDPRLDRPAQFAAIRTDTDLNPVGDPVMFYAKPPRDCLVQPAASLVTGITPQYADEHGVREVEFIRLVRDAMMQPDTCSVGYNSIRFDDEVTRNTLYRNFYDPYEREYKNGNSRWDLIDVVRLCYALRPDGMTWPVDDSGLPTFRLERLTEANHIEQQGAHDALVDVRATIELARKIRSLQPKLFDYALSLRNKQTVAAQLKVGSFTPVFHVSSMFGAENHSASIVLPVAFHPTNRNEVICFDLRKDPEEFFSLDARELAIRQFSSKEQLAMLAKERGVESLNRLPLKSIHINRSPMIAPVKLLDDATSRRLNIDKAQARANMDRIMAQKSVGSVLVNLFDRQVEPVVPGDPDRMLYSGGFFNDHDKKLFDLIHTLTPEALGKQSLPFTDIRLPDMLFRFRGRNYPETLTEEESKKWQHFCRERIRHAEAGVSVALDDYRKLIRDMRVERQDAAGIAILDQLERWGEKLSSM